MSELKKLETTGYSSKLDEIAKNDTEVFLKVKLSGRRTFGEYEFEPKNGFAVHFGNHMDVLDLDKCDVYQLEQPQLNENQQIVFEWLKGNYVQGYGAAVIRTIHLLQKENTVDISDSSYVRGAYRALNTVEEAVVVKMFADWALEQEAE